MQAAPKLEGKGPKPGAPDMSGARGAGGTGAHGLPVSASAAFTLPASVSASASGAATSLPVKSKARLPIVGVLQQRASMLEESVFGKKVRMGHAQWGVGGGSESTGPGEQAWGGRVLRFFPFCFLGKEHHTEFFPEASRNFKLKLKLKLCKLRLPLALLCVVLDIAARGQARPGGQAIR